MAKNYVKGNGKKIDWKFWQIINISLNLEDLKRLPQNKGYIKLTISDRKEPDQYWNNVVIYENEYSWKQTWSTNNKKDIEENF